MWVNAAAAVFNFLVGAAVDADRQAVETGAVWKRGSPFSLRRLLDIALELAAAFEVQAQVREKDDSKQKFGFIKGCLLYTSPSPRDRG